MTTGVASRNAAWHSRLALAMAALLLPAATPPSQLTLFTDRFYRGPARTFTADQRRIDPAIEPQSLTITGRWLVCDEADFAGKCLEADRDYPVAAGLGPGFRVRSVRRLDPGEGAGEPAAGVVPGGASLTGMASRYWAAPTYGSARVRACPEGKSSPNAMPSLDCAHDTAEALCRRAGYRSVRYWQLQTVGTQAYLSDILCIRSEIK